MSKRSLKKVHHRRKCICASGGAQLYFRRSAIAHRPVEEYDKPILKREIDFEQAHCNTLGGFLQQRQKKR